MPSLNVNFRKPSGTEPVGDMAHQAINVCGDLTLEDSTVWSCAPQLFLQALGP